MNLKDFLSLGGADWHPENDRGRGGYQLPPPDWMEPVPAGYEACESDEERRDLILAYHARKAEALISPKRK